MKKIWDNVDEDEMIDLLGINSITYSDIHNDYWDIRYTTEDDYADFNYTMCMSHSEWLYDRIMRYHLSKCPHGSCLRIVKGVVIGIGHAWVELNDVILDTTVKQFEKYNFIPNANDYIEKSCILSVLNDENLKTAILNNSL